MTTQAQLQGNTFTVVPYAVGNTGNVVVGIGVGDQRGTVLAIAVGYVPLILTDIAGAPLMPWG